MTSLVCLLLSIAAAFGFARYNRSNKLFWVLTICLFFGFTACRMVSSAFANHESEVSIKKSTPAPMWTPTWSHQALQPSDGAGTNVETKSTGQAQTGVDSLAYVSFSEDTMEQSRLQYLTHSGFFDTS